MFDHVGVVVKDLKASRVLYTDVLGEIGIRLLEDNSEKDGTGWLVFGTDAPETPFFVISGSRPTFWTDAHRVAASPAHLAFRAPSHQAVDRFHATGLRHGARNNGDPGPRRKRYYAAYLIDFDGNNVEAGVYSDG